MAHLQSIHSEYPDTIPFSLFEGDLVTRLFQRLGMGSYRTIDLVKRSLCADCPYMGCACSPRRLVGCPLDKAPW